MAKRKKYTGPKIDNALVMAESVRELLRAKGEYSRPWDLFNTGFYCIEKNRVFQGFINNMILAAQKFQKGFDSDCFGTKIQWDNAFKLAGLEDCRIVKGCKAEHVFRPNNFKKKIDGKPVLDSKGDQVWIKSYSTYPIFNADQIVDSDKVVKPLDKPNNSIGSIDSIDSYISHSGIVTLFQGNRAFYSPIGNQIGMPAREAFKTLEGFYTTWLHEVTHATGHESRCKRQLMNPKGGVAYAKEELIAEIGSYYLYGLFGLECKQPEQHGSYLNSWLSILDDDPKYIFEACKQAQRAIRWLDESQPASQRLAA